MNSFSSRKVTQLLMEFSVTWEEELDFASMDASIEAASRVQDAYFSTCSGVIAAPLATTLKLKEG